MFCDVLKTLLHDAKQAGRDRERKRAWKVLFGHPHSEARALGKILRVVADRRRQSRMLQQRGVQPISQAVEIIGEAAQFYPQGGEPGGERDRRFGRASLQRGQIEQDRGQTLADVVVEVPRDAAPFLLCTVIRRDASACICS